MIYRYSISTTIAYSETNKLVTVLPLGRGIIHQIDIIFPPGSTALLHLHLNRGLHQIWPSNVEESFASDNDIFSFKEHYELLQRPFQLEAYTWNDSTSHSHGLVIRIGILPRKFILRRLF